jgi:hypothetical protein
LSRGCSRRPAQGAGRGPPSTGSWRFLGRLRKALDADVCNVLDDAIDKDLLQLDRRSLTQRFFPDAPRAPRVGNA